jgi:hypothetical protein
MSIQSSAFETANYLIVKQALSAEICALLTEYALFKAELNPIKRKDALNNVHREYNDPLMETLLKKLTPIIENATHKALWPTLSFYYVYKNGTQLAPHKDRSSCQFVAGLYIGADLAFQSQPDGWPLIIEESGHPTPISLQPGDLVIFKGHETTHWRNTFTGDWFVSAIFGYVDKAGPFHFQKYDQRKQLGKPHVGMFRWLLGCLKHQIKSRFFPAEEK